MKVSILIAALAASGLALTGPAMAKGKPGNDNDNVIINDVFSNRTDTQLSGSGDTILENCGASSGNQAATLNVEQSGGKSEVKINVTGARANTVYTIWLRMKGSTDTGNFGGSSLTGGGATPLAASSDLPTLIANSPGANPAGTAYPVNGFTTDANGDASWNVDLDFPIQGGSYPFNAVGAAPAVIANPLDAGVSAPFLLRVISHCTDDAGHGLSPGTREAWFQYP